MASQAVIDAVTTEVTNAFPTLTVRKLLNEQDPDPPRTEDALDNGWIGLEFPTSTESLRSLGDASNNNWTENGAFIVHVFIASGTLETVATSRDEQIKTLFRSRQIGTNNEISILDLFEPNAGDRYGGNWFAISRGFGFERDFHG